MAERAARDTGDMIQNSMAKAELGSHIAGETAASLTKIANGINGQSALLQELISRFRLKNTSW
jgi:methyl-accepting chemotaxis protein